LRSIFFETRIIEKMIFGSSGLAMVGHATARMDGVKGDDEPRLPVCSQRLPGGDLLGEQFAVGFEDAAGLRSELLGGHLDDLTVAILDDR